MDEQRDSSKKQFDTYYRPRDVSQNSSNHGNKETGYNPGSYEARASLQYQPRTQDTITANNDFENKYSSAVGSDNIEQYLKSKYDNDSRENPSPMKGARSTTADRQSDINTRDQGQWNNKLYNQSNSNDERSRPPLEQQDYNYQAKFPFTPNMTRSTGFEIGKGLENSRPPRDM